MEEKFWLKWCTRERLWPIWCAVSARGTGLRAGIWTRDLPDTKLQFEPRDDVRFYLFLRCDAVKCGRIRDFSLPPLCEILTLQRRYTALIGSYWPTFRNYRSTLDGADRLSRNVCDYNQLLLIQMCRTFGITCFVQPRRWKRQVSRPARYLQVNELTCLSMPWCHVGGLEV
jgi:hypothetical protein